MVEKKFRLPTRHDSTGGSCGQPITATSEKIWVCDVPNCFNMWSTSNYHSRVLRTLVIGITDAMFLSYWACWFAIRYCRSNNIDTGFFNNWLTDFVFVPIVLHFANIMANVLFGKGQILTVRISHAIFLSISTTLAFEVLLPRTTTHNVADWGDALAYLLGGIWYCTFHQPIFTKKLIHLNFSHEN